MDNPNDTNDQNNTGGGVGVPTDTSQAPVVPADDSATGDVPMPSEPVTPTPPVPSPTGMADDPAVTGDEAPVGETPPASPFTPSEPAADDSGNAGS